MLIIDQSDELIIRQKQLGLTKYTPEEIRAGAAVYNAALDTYQAAYATAREALKPFIGTPEIWGLLPDAPQEATPIWDRLHGGAAITYCQVNLKRSEAFPLSVWNKAARKLQREARRLAKLVAQLEHSQKAGSNPG